MKGFFGYYIKCQGNDGTVAIIFGKSEEKNFIQVITEDETFNYEFPTTHIGKDFEMSVGENRVNKNGITMNIEKIFGKIEFGKFTKINGDIMGPFRFLPFMECKHMIISMHHEISGQLTIGGKTYNFDNGIGYIEGDRGKGFPHKYFWSQAHFDGIDISASCAIIPYLGIRFKGTICVVMIDDREYRLATYRGARVKRFDKNGLTIKQGKYKLVIEVLDEKNSLPLQAPTKGKMTRIIHESVKSKVRYIFMRGEETLFDLASDRAAYEFSDLNSNKSNTDCITTTMSSDNRTSS